MTGAASHTRPQKILYVINHMDWFWSHRLPLAKGAQNAGLDVHIAAHNTKKEKNLTKIGFFSHEIPVFSSIFSFFSVFFALYKIIKSEKPNIVHAITLKYAFLTGLISVFFPKTRFVHTIAGLGYLFSGEGMKPKILRFVLGPFLRLALTQEHTALIFQNPDDQALMIERGFAKPERAVLIRGSGVDLEQFNAASEPEISDPQNPVIITMPTRLLKEKGVHIFVEAAQLLKEKSVHVHMRLAGGLSASNPSAYSHEEMQALLKNSSVEWLGKVEDMPGLYASSHIIAYPSHYREGVPKVLLESASSGRPIITTDHPGCREAVQDGISGILIPVKDPAALTAAIEKLANDKELRCQMGRAARKLAEETFDVRHIVRQTMEVYRLEK